MNDATQDPLLSPRDLEFEGLVAIVSGGSSGIGAATVALLRSRGALVANVDQLADPGDQDSFQCDVSNSQEVDAVVAAIAHKYGGLDILINNAGIGATGDIASNSDADWHRVYDVNVFGTMRMSRASLPHLRQSKSAAIVNTGSVVAFVGVPQRALYSSSKGAISALTRAMAADHVREGIRVNAVLPGTADTPWVSRLLAESDDAAAAAESLRDRQPIGRLVSADEVAHAVAYLASPRSRSTTGCFLTVDGGMGPLRLPTA